MGGGDLAHHGSRVAGEDEVEAGLEQVAGGEVPEGLKIAVERCVP